MSAEYRWPEESDFALDELPSQIFEQAAPFSPNKQNIRVHRPDGQSDPSSIVRLVRYYDYFGPHDHLRHLDALGSAGLNIADIRLQVGAYDVGHLAVSWISPSTRLLSESIGDPLYIDSLKQATGGLETYAEWAIQNKEPYIMFDIFSLGQFVYGTSCVKPTPSLWLVDVEPMVCPTSNFVPPISQLRSQVRLLAEQGKKWAQ